MTASDSGPAPTGAGETFVWHPKYAGSTREAVQQELLAEVQSDQRAYALALEGAEQYESEALQSVLQLDRKWGLLSLDWAEADPVALAEVMTAAEWQREERREMTPLAELTAGINRPGLEPPPAEEEKIRLTNPNAQMIVLVVMLVLVLVLVWRLFF